MPSGYSRCPVCGGSGTISESATDYEFLTRNPIDAKCLICNGTGLVNKMKKLPDGTRVKEIKAVPIKSSKRPADRTQERRPRTYASAHILVLLGLMKRMIIDIEEVLGAKRAL